MLSWIRTIFFTSFMFLCFIVPGVASDFASSVLKDTGNAPSIPAELELDMRLKCLFGAVLCLLGWMVIVIIGKHKGVHTKIAVVPPEKAILAPGKTRKKESAVDKSDSGNDSHKKNCTE